MMPAMLGCGGAGPDISPVAMLATDIAAVGTLRERQQKRHDEITGTLPAGKIGYSSTQPEWNHTYTISVINTGWSARRRAALHGQVGAPRRGRPPLLTALPAP